MTMSYEPIAILGAGCRFPGNISSLKSFWKALTSGIDAICDVPADRWNMSRFYSENKGAQGKMYIRKGGFLQQRLDEMDAGFFGLSPREAAYLDPQQRLLLEVAWEALEDAGLVAERLAGVGHWCLHRRFHARQYAGAVQPAQPRADRAAFRRQFDTQHSFEPPVLHVRPARAECDDGYRLLFFTGGAALRLSGDPARRMRGRAGWRRQRHAPAGNTDRHVQRRLPRAGRPLQKLRRAGRRLRPR